MCAKGTRPLLAVVCLVLGRQGTIHAKDQKPKMYTWCMSTVIGIVSLTALMHAIFEEEEEVLSFIHYNQRDPCHSNMVLMTDAQHQTGQQMRNVDTCPNLSSSASFRLNTFTRSCEHSQFLLPLPLARLRDTIMSTSFHARREI